jgi:predicted short-subunit dehydrogenase-like oxidoreductase (DUF2520 family)
MAQDSILPTLGFIGAGTTGTALAVRLAGCGYSVAAVWSRTPASAQRLAGRARGCLVVGGAQGVADAAGLVFITTPDDAISQVAGSVRWHAGRSVVHCSGAHSVDILDAASRQGAVAGCFHPLQTFAGIDRAIELLPHSTFALEAQEPLLSVLKEMAAALEGHGVVLGAGDKVVYHAAAVFASNYLVTIVKLATDLWQTFGVPPEQATRALMPLLRGTLSNIDGIGLPGCLTGPVARGDVGTIRKHLDALGERAPSILEAYRKLGSCTVPIALAKGKIDDRKAGEMLELFKKP